MQWLATNQYGPFRTVVVLICGILLFIVASTCLERLFAPNTFAVIRNTDTPHSPEQSALLSEQLSHLVNITVFFVDPLAAIVVGLFVGLLQAQQCRFPCRMLSHS